MTIEDLPDIVYHGTISKYKKKFEIGIDLQCGKKFVDFGKGFYTTFNYNQAETFAQKRADYQNDLPMVITYNINKSLLKELDCNFLSFDEKDDKWVEFVYNNRMNRNGVITDFHNKDNQYDIVYGCVADGAIAYYTRMAQKKQVDYNEFVKSIKYPQNDSYNQLSFHSEKSLKILTLSGIKIIHNDKEEILCLK